MTDDVHNAGMSEAELDEAFSAVMTYASQRGLYGVMILSPYCTRCGGMHDWRLMVNADMVGRETTPDAEEERRAQIIGLLQHHVDALQNGEVDSQLHEPGKRRMN